MEIWKGLWVPHPDSPSIRRFSDSPARYPDYNTHRRKKHLYRRSGRINKWRYCWIRCDVEIFTPVRMMKVTVRRWTRAGWRFCCRVSGSAGLSPDDPASVSAGWWCPCCWPELCKEPLAEGLSCVWKQHKLLELYIFIYIYIYQSIRTRIKEFRM